MKSAKYLFADTETSGTDAKRDALLQLAALKVSEDGEVLDEFETRVRPFFGRRVCSGALDVNGAKYSDLERLPPLFEVIPKFMRWLDQDQQLIFAGYNCKFDMAFIASAIRIYIASYGRPAYFSDTSHWRLPKITDVEDETYPWRVDEEKGGNDVLVTARRLLKKPQVENHKLVTVAKYFEIEFEAHDAMADIKATVEVWKRLEAMKVKA